MKGIHTPEENGLGYGRSEQSSSGASTGLLHNAGPQEDLSETAGELAMSLPRQGVSRVQNCFLVYPLKDAV